MGKILVHEFITLDGVIDEPKWTMGFSFDPKMGEAIGGMMGSAEGLLLGRTTFEMFAPAWSARTAEQDPGAPFMNDSMKYVVSSRLEDASQVWSNSTVIGPYSPDSIRELKERTAGDLYVSGSGTLVRAMLADGLVDELHLFVFPLTLGSGQRLFAEGGPSLKFTLAREETYESGVVYQVYSPAE